MDSLNIKINVLCATVKGYSSVIATIIIQFSSIKNMSLPILTLKALQRPAGCP